MDKQKETKIENEFLSVAEAAELSGYSRQHVVRLINAKEIPAQRIGRSFVIAKKDLPGPFSVMTKSEEKEIDKAVTKIYKEYGQALRNLGKE